MAAYDSGHATRESVASRFQVSVGMVKKLLQQHRRLGDLRTQPRRAGRKPRIQADHRLRLRQELAAKTNMTRLLAKAPHGQWHPTTMISSVRLEATTA